MENIEELLKCAEKTCEHTACEGQTWPAHGLAAEVRRLQLQVKNVLHAADTLTNHYIMAQEKIKDLARKISLYKESCDLWSMAAHSKAKELGELRNKLDCLKKSHSSMEKRVHELRQRIGAQNAEIASVQEANHRLGQERKDLWLQVNSNALSEKIAFLESAWDAEKKVSKVWNEEATRWMTEFYKLRMEKAVK